MPRGEIETHPYLELGQATQNPRRMILGSFPVYECTNPITPFKEQRRITEGSARFFYGSINSSFWRMYSNYIDVNIVLPPNPEEILISIRAKQIAISDVIVSCERINYSSEDNKLVRKTYNIIPIQQLIENGVRKILCTSKGVLQTLENAILCRPLNMPYASLNIPASHMLQNSLLNSIEGRLTPVSKPIAKVFIRGDFSIQAIAIPSPGSIQRRLPHFGYVQGDRAQYVRRYLSEAFNWFLQ